MPADKLGDRLAAGMMGAFAGALCAVVAAPVQALATQTVVLAHQARLHYKPRHVFVTCRYRSHAGAEAVEVLKIRALDGVKRMRPLSEADVREPGRLAKEEARATVLVVSERLEALGWKRRLRYN